MRIGIDFDNTIICYDDVFCHLARERKLVPADFSGSKTELRDAVRATAEGDIAWQKLQGKVYGEHLNLAQMFTGVKEFIAACNSREQVEIFIVSHKTEFGHFDEKQINLRDAARNWLRSQGFFDAQLPYIHESNLYFESTREAKIKRIRQLACTHFIDDLTEVLHDPSFPSEVKSFLFQPDGNGQHVYTNWIDIKNAIFPQ